MSSYIPDNHPPGTVFTDTATVVVVDPLFLPTHVLEYLAQELIPAGTAALLHTTHDGVCMVTPTERGALIAAPDTTELRAQCPDYPLLGTLLPYTRAEAVQVLTDMANSWRAADNDGDGPLFGGAT